MKFYKIDLLTLLIGLFLFASCKSSNTIGLDVDPDEAIQGELVDTVTVRTQTLADEPSSTGGLIRYPLGYLVDPVLGTTESSLAMSVNLPSSAFSFGTDAVLDSAVLVLPYSVTTVPRTNTTSTEFYGDSTSIYSVDVHQLNDNLSLQTSFMSNKEWAYNTGSETVPNGVIGNFTGRIRPNTPIKVTEVVTGKADTIVSRKALRIKLDNNFITNNILRLSASALVNTAFFNSAFKGLHVSVNKEKSKGAGALPFFDLNTQYGSSNTNASTLELYFKKKNATTATATDTVQAHFPISNRLNPVAATIKHDYTGTAVETQLKNPGVQYETTFLQGATGLRNKISFPHLANFMGTLGGKIIINKAELVIELSAGTDVAPFVPAPRLALYRYDIAGQATNIPDNLNTDQRVVTDFGGNYNGTAKNYKFIVTSYLQDLLDGKTKDYGTFLSTTPLTEFNLSPLATTAARSVIGSFSNPNNKVKLNIIYTRINPVSKF
jgi:hypothetical protein